MYRYFKKMKRLFPYSFSGALVLLLAAVLLASCGGAANDKKGSGPKGRSTSAPYELLVVANKEWLQTDNGQPLRDIIQAEIPCLPQSETCFRTTIVNPSGFTKTFMFYANIIVADVNPKYRKPACEIARNVYCQPQIIVSLTAPDNASFAALCRQWHDQILDVFNTAELTRERKVLDKTYSALVLNQAKAQFGCEIHAPQAINACKPGKDFFWASSDGLEENYLNICLYSYPYTSDRTFTQDYFLAKRDSFMRENIEGAEDGQYMSTDRRFVQSRNIEVDGRFVQEVRGLWQMEHAAMGGPFISYAQVDTVNGRVLVAEGFVFAPGKDKRKFVRELEATLLTLRLPSRRK